MTRQWDLWVEQTYLIAEEQSTQFTDYLGEQPYVDYEVADDPNGDPQATEILRYLAGFGVHADQDMAQPGGPATYHHGDLIRSTMLLTDESGAANQMAAYTAFGEMVRPSGTIGYDPNAALPTRYQYAGGWGYESGVITLYGANPNLPPLTLQHVGARWYQPDVGRFVQRDPIGIRGGPNVYAYVVANPAVRVDPSGRDTFGPHCPVCGKLICVDPSHSNPPPPPPPTPPPSFPEPPVEYGPRPEPWPKNIVRETIQDYIPLPPALDFITAISNAAANWLRLYCIHVPIDKASSGPLCLAEGTVIQTREGEVCVEDIEVGMQLSSYDVETLCDTTTVVVGIRTSWTTQLVELTIGSETITCSGTHPFWLLDEGWVQASDLRAGCVLLDLHEQLVTVLDAHSVVVSEPVRVFDISVDGTHTYHVGECGVLVHNKPI